jgi:hypothetical protein
MRLRSLALIAPIFLTLVLATAAMAADPFTGTWQLDPSKTEDTNPVQLTLAPSSNGISIQTDDQKPAIAIYGKDSPLNDGTIINLVRVDDHTLKSALNRDGKLQFKETATVSADGKHYSRVQEGTSGNKATLVYKRIGAAPAGDAFLGTWQQEVSKTINEPATTYTIKIDGGTLDFTRNKTHVITAKFDGKSYEARNNATWQLKRIDDHTVEVIRKTSAGTSTDQWRVKGQTLSITSVGTGAQGKPYKQVQYLKRTN